MLDIANDSEGKDTIDELTQQQNLIPSPQNVAKSTIRILAISIRS